MSHRTQRLAEAIREVVSSAILFEVADPRVRAVTVLHAEVSGDHRNATVFVTVMGTEAEQRTAMQGLKSAAGFLQSRVANRLQTRYTPILSFKLDDSVKKSVEMSRLIDETLAADRRNHPGASPSDEPEPPLDDDADLDPPGNPEFDDEEDDEPTED
ncbi:MAG: 30S ribosome-binding factor RbfA [Isosphaeraceae bacterium]